VIGQQISSKAAQSIFDKLVALVGNESDGAIPAAELARLSEADFKSCGISAPKQRTIRAVLDHVAAHPDLIPSVPDLSDDDLRARLTAIKGIGPWTVDMLMMFGLGRPDVWAVGDYGVQVAVKNLFGLRKLPKADRLTKIAKPWQPHRSVASWYLWRSLEPQFRDAPK
jgi:3-methyladenine DNA glycosylase/8-oxoguanine DNA glycosylase